MKRIAKKLHVACEKTRAEQRLRDSAPDLRTERDALRESNRELVAALGIVILHDGKLTGADFARIHAALATAQKGLK